VYCNLSKREETIFQTLLQISVRILLQIEFFVLSKGEEILCHMLFQISVGILFQIVFCSLKEISKREHNTRVDTLVCDTHTHLCVTDMEWLRLVGSLKL